MDTSAKSTDFFKRIERSVSIARFSAYKPHGTSNLEALSTYIWNTLLCESLYPGFQVLEVSFRNAFHSQMATHLKDPDWMSKEPEFLYSTELDEIRRAKSGISLKRGPVTEPLLVSEMGFGFWTSLLDSRYDRMWPKIIAGVFPGMPRTSRTRRDASVLMEAVRKLRNKAMHHHSIWHWGDLNERHSQIVTLIGYICPDALKLVNAMDRFPAVFELGKSAFSEMAKKISN